MIRVPFLHGLAAAWILLPACSDPGAAQARQFKMSLPDSRVIIYPAVVRSPSGVTHDPEVARALAAALAEAGAREILLADEKLPLSDRRSFNQAAMFNSSFAAFGERVRALQPRAEYAAVVEILKGRDGGVGGIHLYVVHPGGARAFGCLLNSHYKGFKAVWPKSNLEAASVLATWLRQEFSRN